MNSIMCMRNGIQSATYNGVNTIFQFFYWFKKKSPKSQTKHGFNQYARTSSTHLINGRKNESEIYSKTTNTKIKSQKKT